MGKRIYPSYQDTNLTAKGTLIINLTTFINDIGIYRNGIYVDTQYKIKEGLCTIPINVGDVITIDSSQFFSLDLNRLDYTTDYENGDDGIKNTSVYSYPTQQSYTFTATTLSNSYNFEYRSLISYPGPTPTPTPSPTPTGTPTPSPTPTPTSTPTPTPTITPTPTPTGGTAFFQVDIALVPSGGINTFSVYKNGVLDSSATTTGDTYNGLQLFRMYFTPSDGQQIKFQHTTTYNSTSFIELGLGFDKRCRKTMTAGNYTNILCDTWVNNTSKFTGGVNYAKYFVPVGSTPSLNCTTC